MYPRIFGIFWDPHGAPGPPKFIVILGWFLESLGAPQGHLKVPQSTLGTPGVPLGTLGYPGDPGVPWDGWGGEAPHKKLGGSGGSKASQQTFYIKVDP